VIEATAVALSYGFYAAAIFGHHQDLY